MESLTRSAEPGPNLQMSNEDLQAPADGEGPLTRRQYRVYIKDSRLSAAALMSAFRGDPNRFSPTAFAVFEPDPTPRGLTEGQDITVKLPGPWDGPVRVGLVTDSSVRLYCRNGHMEAGRIDFTATEEAEVVQFTIDSVARSGDEVFEFVYRRLRIGKQFQSEMWAQVLEAAVHISGGVQQGRLHFRTTEYDAQRRRDDG